MRIAIIGGGPGGLYFASLVKQLDPSREVVVWERNAPQDTFGFGVVFSDETLGGIENADPVIAQQMSDRFARWTDIDIHFEGERFTVGGQGFAAMSRKDLLNLLQRRALDLGVTIHFSSLAPDAKALAAEYDLVIAADGVNSATRTRLADTFKPSLDVRASKYMWLGTDKVFEAFTFIVKKTPYGVMQIHGYPYSDGGSTFIVEAHEDVWRRAGFEESAQRQFAPGESDDLAIARIAEIFHQELGENRILANNSRWINFTTVRNENWVADNIVLIGDAAHTAHFSIGSGTKLAMEDALSLAACLYENGDVASALTAYEAERRPVVASTQRAAQASLEWFESIEQYSEQQPLQFAFNLLTRSRRITNENLALRDRDFARCVSEKFAQSVGGSPDAPAMFQPHRIGGLELKNRIVVSSMDMYSSVDGVPGDFHLMHLGSKAAGGAGLVMTEMVCVSDIGRITPGCAGLYTDEQSNVWRRIVDFVHSTTTAKIGVQLGHSGRKGSTRLMWDGIDEPLPEDNWRTVAPSPVPYGPSNQVPRELDHDALAEITNQFVAAARRAADCRLRHPGAPRSTRLPALVVPLPDLEPPHRSVRRFAPEPPPVPS